MADPRVRQIKIKTGVVKRLIKEKAMNDREIASQEQRVQKYREDPTRDEYDVKKQLEVLEECRRMVPNTQQRLDAAVADLKSVLDSEADLAESQEYKEAQEQLAAAT